MNEYISKEAVVRYLKGYSDKECNSNSPYGMITSSVLNKVERALSEMPAADVQPVKQWMKLHEKHPDTEDFYLVCDQYGECEVAEYLPDIKSWFTHKIKGEIRYWMPLPEPPKDGEHND